MTEMCVVIFSLHWPFLKWSILLVILWSAVEGTLTVTNLNAYFNINGQSHEMTEKHGWEFVGRNTACDEITGQNNPDTNANNYQWEWPKEKL